MNRPLLDTKADWDVVALCREQLELLDGIRTATTRTPVTAALREADVSLSLETEVGSLRYAGSVLRGLRPARLDHWLLRNVVEKSRPGKRERLIVLSDFVSGTMDQRFVEADVDYVDAAGNVLLRWPGKLYVHRTGRRPQQRLSPTAGRLLKPPGLQILFLLLIEPTVVQLSYRDLAYRSGVALGSAAIVLNELRAKAFITTRDKRRSLTRRRELLDLWITGYSGQLRPRLLCGTFEAPDRDSDETMQRVHSVFSRRDLDYATTGGFAADILTRHYRGRNLTLFTSKLSSEMLKELRWLPARTGRITVLRMFAPTIRWSSIGASTYKVAHPLLVYAELLHGGSERERETAQIIYAEHLSPLFDVDTV